jgi:hypothetical protein
MNTPVESVSSASHMPIGFVRADFVLMLDARHRAPIAKRVGIAGDEDRLDLDPVEYLDAVDDEREVVGVSRALPCEDDARAVRCRRKVSRRRRGAGAYVSEVALGVDEVGVARDGLAVDVIPYGDRHSIGVAGAQDS